ncbi:hypothetical protein [Saccharopolyspora spinosa]|uniref:Uncharacterized protein n=1 Tax=Saccharopolyspora spinosa TaxID=60894 RepID=A0A2N3XWX0_SACSN|nr:hypothetical protein [Saccharopolyspora spinosa]PKW15164.1 hypothetical protein A8926_2852 [Saccharopolyspora spinosa]
MRDESRHDQLFEELRLLLDAAAGKAEEYLRGCDQDADSGGRASCGWCPLCAAVGLLRGHRPELNDQLAGIVQSLRQMLADARPVEKPEESEESGESEEDVPVVSKVQRIRVQRVGGTVLADDEPEAVSQC